MSRLTAPIVPTWGQISAYTSDTQVALSTNMELLGATNPCEGRALDHGDE